MTQPPRACRGKRLDLPTASERSSPRRRTSSNKHDSGCEIRSGDRWVQRTRRATPSCSGSSGEYRGAFLCSVSLRRLPKRPASIAFSGRRSGRTLCSTHHTESIRPTIHPAVSRTDPTPRQAVLQYSADQLRREHDSWEVRIADRLAHERLANCETDHDRRSGTTRTRTGATLEGIGMGPAHLPGPLAGP